MEGSQKEVEPQENGKEKNDKTNSYLEEVEEELLKAKMDFKNGKTNGKDDSKIEKMLKLVNLIKWSSTLNILKNDKEAIEIIPHLFLGSVGCASNLDELQKKNITHIVCCAKDLKKFFPDKFQYMNIDLLDDEKENIRKYFDDTNKFIKDGIDKNGSVLIHCFAGVSRSSSILIAYLMKHKNMKVDKALETLKSKREKACPNPGFMKQLNDYEKELNI